MKNFNKTRFEYILHPSEPKTSGGRDLSLIDWVDSVNRKSLKDQVWQSALKNNLL